MPNIIQDCSAKNRSSAYKQNFYDPNAFMTTDGRKTTSFWAPHDEIAHVREYPTPLVGPEILKREYKVRVLFFSKNVPQSRSFNQIYALPCQEC